MLLEKLCNASAPSGYEGEVRKLIKDELRNYIDNIKLDRMGNIIVNKKGRGIKVVVDAHMDEVGFIITGYNDDGTLKFDSLGIINSKVVPCKTVSIGKNKLPGIIGLKPIHLQSKKEAEKIIPINRLCIDIGARSKEEARKIVPIGEYAVFSTTFEHFGEGLVKGKALDNRVGCSILLDILKETYNCDLYGVFSSQKEIEYRGAYAPAFQIQPDIVIILEGTVCEDMPNVDDNLKATEINKGPALSIMDEVSIFDPSILTKLKKLAKSKDIPYQIRKSTISTNDAGAYIINSNGVKVVTISVPCRYNHSSISVCSMTDYNNAVKLVKEYIKSL